MISRITYSNSKSSVGLPLGTRFGTSAFRCLGRMRVSSRPAAHEVHELGELFIGELERRLEKRVETHQYWLDWAQWPL